MEIAEKLDEIMERLEKIADQIGQIEDLPKLGSFDPVSEEDLAQIEKLQTDFDDWFEILVKNFDLDTHYPNPTELQNIKNLVRHGWNANSRIENPQDSQS